MNTEKITSLSLMQFMSRELMHLTGVRRCLCIRTYDVTREQHVFRWFGGGRTVGMRVPTEANWKEAEQYAQAALEAWQSVEAGPDDGAKYERLKREAESVGYDWMEERIDDDA